MAATARVCERQDQLPFLERRILFHPPKDTALLAALPPGIEPLNHGFNAATRPPPPSLSKSPDGKGIKRSWEEANGEPQKDFGENVLPELGAPLRIGAGLTNLGNTCFLNSVLQCLTYTQPLAEFLKSGQHKLLCRKSGFCAMCALEGHVRNALQSWGKVIAPNHMVKNLRSISRAFQPWRQEDAHEFLRYLMEALQKDCLPSKTPMNSPEQEKTLLYKIFGGRLRSQVKCSNCLERSETVDPFLDLSLDITRADSLGKALAWFTANEILDGDNKYHCEKCKKKVRAIKRFTIETAPNVLTVQFKRFSSTGLHGQKIDKKVHFGRKLDITPFMSNARDGAVYDLYGVLVHAGWSTRSGHYYCFVRTSSDMWHVLDDSRVQQLSEQTVLNQKAYILFYIRKTPTQRLPSAPATEISGKKIATTKPLHMPDAVPAAKIEERETSLREQEVPAATITKEREENSPDKVVTAKAKETVPAATDEEGKAISEEDICSLSPVAPSAEKRASPEPELKKEGTVPASRIEPENQAPSMVDKGSTKKLDKRDPEKLERELPKGQISLKKFDTDPPRRPEKGYLKLLKAMPKNRRLLMEKALEGGIAEGTAASKSKKLVENDDPKKKKKCSPNELFGTGVARWEGVDGKEVDGFLSQEHKVSTKRPDEWDEEYDRGRLKKLRRSAGGGRLTPLKSCENANPFQALTSKKKS
ncbi:ubiquitin carboxyl-terminal hydrolase 23 [Selaginella moellendorffii]|uniref:ubiquitin carboxyl-terminal hydrolase 23 n=1 Tax=Selaginella moellendorffii TaxID=88036 RepID=UPI000D1C6614|nr:ubiquitin carboxyl-terminal hydrolase 23 [Selaginella moellendorffii]|eukprot:XP_024518765.1 ubiquitin carboxyl-terminal hydrolase 23 [Selaginella moellendorffii]